MTFDNIDETKCVLKMKRLFYDITSTKFSQACENSRDAYSEDALSE